MDGTTQDGAVSSGTAFGGRAFGGTVFGGTAWAGVVDLPPARRAPLIGQVAEFDDPRGLGVVDLGDGRHVGFHCTAITDGTRTIEVGAPVACMLGPGHLGRLEAVAVRPLAG